jgi:hypothetical protein
VQDILAVLQERDEFETIELNLETHQGVTIHRIQGRNSSPEDLRVYGGRPSVYLGTSSRYAWFGYGGEEALTTLKNAIDHMATATPEERNNTTLAPFQVVFHVSPWLDLPQPEDAGEGRQRFRELTEEAFEADNDALRVDVRPTETGMRFRIQVDEGFLRLMALGISELIDENI